MHQRKPSRGILFIVFIFLLYASCSAQVDSLVDCFPLSIGNQWIYHYYRWVVPAEFSVLNDTGRATYTILGRVDFPDSVLWNFKEQRDIHRMLSIAGVRQSDSVILDSTLFNLVELKSGRHELYRRIGNPGSWWEYDASPMWNSVMPFMHVDSESSKLFRFYRLDSEDAFFLNVNDEQQSMAFMISLKKNSGLRSLYAHANVTEEFPSYSDHKLIQQTITDIPEYGQAPPPMAILLEQNFPNPFNPSTRIDYDLPTLSTVSLSIYDVLGKEITRLFEWQSQIGHQTTWFDGTGLPSGVYYAKLSTDKSVLVRKMMLIR